MSSSLSASASVNKAGIPHDDHTRPRPLPWQAPPPSRTYVLGFPYTKDVARKAGQRFYPLPEDATSQEIEAHRITSYQLMLCALRSKYPIPGRYRRFGAIAFLDKTHTMVEYVIALVDLRSSKPSERQLPTPEAVEMIADELELEGPAREPRWYKLADLDY